MSRYLILTLAFLVGILSIAPYLYAYWFVGPEPASVEGEKLHYFYQDSESRYISRMRDITEGYWPVASPVFHEYKEATQIQQPFGEGMYAVLALGQAELLSEVIMFTKFALPVVLFLLLYTLCFRLLTDTGALSLQSKRALAALIAFVIAQGINTHRLGYLLSLLSMDYIGPILSIWTRTVNPIFGALILFGVLALVVSGKRNEFVWWRAVTIGLLVGLSSAYFFSLVLAVSILLVWGAFHILYREWRRFAELIVAAIISLGINISYFTYILFGETDGLSLEKNGLFFTHEPVSNNGLIVASLVFVVAIAVYRCRQSLRELFTHTWSRFGLAVLVGSFIAYNQQVITGVTVWPSHFIQYTDPLTLIVICTSLIMIGVAVLDWRWLRSVLPLKRYVNPLIVIVVPLLIGILLTIQIFSVMSVRVWENEYVDIQRYVPVFSWLNEQSASEDCVVLLLPSVAELSSDIGAIIYDYFTAYTSCDSYHSHYVYMALPDERIMHNYIAFMRLRGVTPDTVDEYLVTHEREWRDLIYDDWTELFSHRDLKFLNDFTDQQQVEQHLQETPIEILNAFLDSLNTPLHEWLNKYQLDYIVYNTSLAVEPSPAQLGSVVFEANGLQIIAVKK